MKINMAKRNGFTLAEALITLGLIGVVAALTIVTLAAVKPDKNAIKLRKAYYSLEKAVNDMINDDSLYPDYVTGDAILDLTNGTAVTKNYPQGFANSSTVGISGANGTNKFCYVLSQELNIKGVASCTGDPNDVETPITLVFTTTDGVEWRFPCNSVFLADVNYPVPFSVDVNGQSNGPNCGNYISKYQRSTGGTYIQGVNCPAGSTRDLFYGTIRFDGKIDLDGNAQAILQTQTKNTK